MTAPTNSTQRIWDSIDQEKRRDRTMQRISIAAWTATLILVFILLVIGGISAAQMVRAALNGAVPWVAVLGTMLPVIIVLGLLTALIAVLSTIATFLRTRTVTLHEIQLRLAALEDALTTESGKPST
jgi:uncharacterized membrane protein